MQVLFSSTVSGSFSIGGRGPSGGTAPPIVIGRSTTTTTPSRLAAGAPITINRSTPGLTTSSGPVTIATGPQGAVTIRNFAPTTTATSPPGLAWSQVRTQTWTAFGISLALALAAAVVLLIAILRRRTIIHAVPSRLFVGVALGIFAVYAAGQVFLFARDIAG
jgi:hypothetical protein